MLSLVCDVLHVQLAILNPCLESRNLQQSVRQTLTKRSEVLSDYVRTYSMLQQDGATADTAINLVLCLQSYFGNRVTSREFWTHISSYLITSDFLCMRNVNGESEY
jgi:hypothetical protein